MLTRDYRTDFTYPDAGERMQGGSTVDPNREPAGSVEAAVTDEELAVQPVRK